MSRYIYNGIDIVECVNTENCYSLVSLKKEDLKEVYKMLYRYEPISTVCISKKSLIEEIRKFVRNIELAYTKGKQNGKVIDTIANTSEVANVVSEAELFRDMLTELGTRAVYIDILKSAYSAITGEYLSNLNSKNDFIHSIKNDYKFLAG